MVFKHIILLVTLSLITSSCALWPYKKDFDCPITEGLKCKSLYEISMMADEGLFGPHAIRSKCVDSVKTKQLRNTRTTKSNNQQTQKLGYCTNG